MKLSRFLAPAVIRSLALALADRRSFPRFLALALALALGSCSPDPNAGKINIRYMAWGNPEQLALEEQLCERFNQDNPDIHVRFLKVPGSAYANKSVVMLASNTAPDVMRVDHYDFAGLQRKRFFMDLTPFAEKDPTYKESDFFPQTVEECKVKGRLYALNVLFGATVIYYNRTLFEQAGIEDPYKLWTEGKWTTDKFVELAQKLTKKDQNNKYIQFGTGFPPFPNWVPLLWAFGGELVDPQHKTSRLDQRDSVAGLQFIADLRYKYACSPTPAQGANASFAFETGKLGMHFDWMGMIPRFRKVVTSFDWDVVPLPRGPKSAETCVKGNQLVVPASCTHPEAAWRFARYLTSPEIESLLYVKNRRCFPTRVAIANSKEYLDNALPPKQIHVFLDAVRTGRQLPIDDRWGEWRTAMNNELDLLWNGTSLDVKAVAGRAAGAVTKVLSEEPGW